MARSGVAVPTERSQGGVFRQPVSTSRGHSMMTLLAVGLAVLLLVFWSLLHKKA
jgi:hypothetical protein